MRIVLAALVGFRVRQHAQRGWISKACSFKHSDISPFEINDLRVG